MKREAVAKNYQVLSLHACMSMSSASFPASGFDVTLPGCPTLTSFQDFSVFTLGHSSLSVPINLISIILSCLQLKANMSLKDEIVKNNLTLNITPENRSKIFQNWLKARFSGSTPKETIQSKRHIQWRESELVNKGQNQNVIKAVTSCSTHKTG